MAAKDDGGPAFVATAKYSDIYMTDDDIEIERWEQTLPLRGDETMADVWTWARKQGASTLSSIVIVKADAMLAERAKQENG